MKNKKIKNVVVIYWGNDWNCKIPISNEITRHSFEKWHEMGIKKGIEMYRASINWYDLRKNVFIKSWAFRNKKWIKIEKNIRPDLVYDKVGGKRDFKSFEKKLHIAKNVKMFNNPLFRVMVNSKLSQYAIFGEFMPKSFVAMDKSELIQMFSKIKSKKIVIKPLYGSGGHGIVIDEKEKAINKKYQYPVLVQEFIVSEKGIPGFSKKKEISDLRLVFMNHKLSYALSRIAKKGSLFTNLHQGASGTLVPVKYIPKEVVKIAEKIIKKLKIFPEAQYSLDFIFSNSGKPYFVEMNTTPGIDLITVLGDEKIKRKSFEDIINLA
ncbi:MAG TPA: ATP-grasp domain-containing protein [Candidatus Moranbacteria bacterium]|nr:ATP-grasp domain-containing protein [Candidatus Moranbacteria bacterium]HRZ33484.1 ATP-grasp domain-containing protein [Candidatus Moranbacteria bacterium]